VKLPKKLQVILDVLPIHIYWTDKETRIEGANISQAVNFGDESVESCIGKQTYDFAKQLGWSKDFADRIHNEHLYVIKTGNSSTTEYTGVLADGKEHTYLSHKHPLKIRGEIVGLVGVSIDITERKKMEIELKKSKEQAEESSKLKSQFISDMEHDLRTPCSGIAAMTEILEKKATDQETKENLHHVAKASARLLDILNGILSFDQTVSGTLLIVDKKFSIKKVIDDILAIETPSVISKKLKLTIDYDNNIPETIIGDEHRIARILLNVISNAIKFTSKGHVTVSVKLPKIIDNQHAVLQVIVEDTGIGIPADKLKHIYERFVRVVPANKNLYAGAGLGLSVVKRFIEDIDGEIDAESTLGKGSKFICTIPVKIPLVSSEATEDKEKATKTEESKTTSKQKLKILLVEDDTLAQVVASNLLKGHFFGQLDTASSGKEAVQLAYQTKYNLILMDIGLPDTNGYEVTKKIRKSGSSRNKKTTIVALTAHDSAEEKKKSVDVGMNDFLTKPLNNEKIKQILQKFLPKKSKASKKPEIKTAIEKSKEKIPIKKPGLKVIDLEKGAELVGGNKDMALDMLRILIEELPENLKLIQSLFEAKDFEEMKKVAHKLHGGLCYCGAPRLKEAIKQLEVALKSAGDREKISDYYTRLCNEITLILEEYKKL